MSDKMSDDLREQLKEISAELYALKIAARNMEEPDILDKALFGIIRQIDSLTEK